MLSYAIESCAFLLRSGRVEDFLLALTDGYTQF